MYIILIYDVNQSRVGKFLKTCRKYLHWIQNSVFEGELSDSKLKKLEEELLKNTKGNDSIILFKLWASYNIVERKIIGKEKNKIDFIVD